MIRFTSRQPCPVCGGHKDLPQGIGVRCHGFLSQDGEYAHCTREDKAGPLPLGKDEAYAHRLGGSCKCGATHGGTIVTPKQDTKSPKWRPIPVPATAPEPTFKHRDYGSPSGLWAYRNEAGQVIGYRVRFDTAEGGKVVLPYTWCVDDNPATARNEGWQWKDHPTPRPLYGLDRLAADPFAAVLLVEGEKTANAAQLLFRDLVVVSCSGGDNGPKHTDFGPLAGRDVIGWPDNDKPGAKCMAMAAGPIKLAGAVLRVVDLPAGLPESWDLADEFPATLTIEAARKLIAAAPAWGADEVVSRQGYHLTEGGNAERLVDRFGGDLRHNQAMGWLFWDGCRWKQDEGEVPEVSKAIIAELYADAEKAKAEARDLGHPKDNPEAKEAHRQADELMKHAKASDRAKAIVGMCEMARSVPLLRSKATDFDGNDPNLPDDHPKRFLLNAANGIIDLRTGQLVEHDRSQMITKAAGIAYDPSAQCPTWERFIADIMGGDPEMVTFLQRAIGYTLTGSCSEQAFFILYGSGSNGKTVFTNILTAIMGDYAGETATETLMTGKRDAGGPTEDLARLAGLRLVGANETDEGQRFSEARIKALTGNDPVTARELYKGSFTYRPQFKLWLRTNHKPIIRGNDEGIWRRPRLVPFTQTFAGARKDASLPAKLQAELPGILAWAVRGCLEWQRIGLGWPAAVAEATEAYRSEMDGLGRFLLDQGHLEPVRAKVLYDRYVEWCESMGEYAMSLQALGRRLTERGWGKRADPGNSIVRVPPAEKPHYDSVTDIPENTDIRTVNPHTPAHMQAHAHAQDGTLGNGLSGSSGGPASNGVPDKPRIISATAPLNYPSSTTDDSVVL